MTVKLIHDAEEVTCAAALSPDAEYRRLHLHFQLICEDCETYLAARRGWENNEELTRQGYLTQETWLAFAHVWRTASFWYPNLGAWAEPTPTDPIVRRRARKILRHGRRDVPAALLEPAIGCDA